PNVGHQRSLSGVEKSPYLPFSQFITKVFTSFRLQKPLLQRAKILPVSVLCFHSVSYRGPKILFAFY
ncbi:MAG: hypothetical protein NC357_08005, partial [Bacteroides sp.]|nr:hypothetical protein [Bacteroides sp.]